MFRGDHLAKSPHRNVAETRRRRKQLPIFQLITEHRVGDVVGGERKKVDLDEQSFARKRGDWQSGFDQFALLQIVARDDEVKGFHCSGSRYFSCRDLCFHWTLFGNSNIV
jgi:hypothetical protein